MLFTPDHAEEYLAFHLEWDSEPVLGSSKQEALLRYARAVDVNGLSPGTEDYDETYTLNSVSVAIHLGWTWKLAAAVELHEDDENEIFDHCQQMVNIWAAKIEGTAIGGTQSGSGSFAIPNIPVF